jgi:ABC-2 type transport system permease protein
MLLFGAIWGTQVLDPTDPQSFTLIGYMVPSMIVLSLMSNGLVGNAGAMAVWREKGILRRIQATPLPVWQFLLARILMQATIMVGQAGLLIGTSVVAFGTHYDPWALVEVIPAVVVGAVLFMAMGQAVAAVVRKSETVGLVAQVLNFPLMFLGGLAIPLQALPEGLRAVGKYLPSSMMAALVRAPLLAGLLVVPCGPLTVAAVGVAVYFLVAVGVAARWFKWS